MIGRSLLLLIAVSGACLLACGSSDSGGGTGSDPKVCVAHLNPTPAALATPVTNFESEVAPILVQSCAFSSCHASQQAIGNHGVYLSAKTSADMPLVKAALLAKSQANPAMPYVTPGDPDKSFLLHKLDGDLCVIEDKCVNGSCGNSMPDGNDPLPDTSRDAIRRWIAQGAK